MWLLGVLFFWLFGWLVDRTRLDWFVIATVTSLYAIPSPFQALTSSPGWLRTAALGYY